MAAIEPVKGISDRGLSRLRRYSRLDASVQIVDNYWNTLESPIKKIRGEDVSESSSFCSVYGWQRLPSLNRSKILRDLVPIQAEAAESTGVDG
jgi:hypothetical protein